VIFHRTLLFATILLLIYPTPAASQRGTLEPPSSIVESSGNRKDPELLKQVMPPYTEEARKARKDGVVVLLCIVRKDGNADSCRSLSHLGYGLDESAINTIETNWRFKPATYEGKPVDAAINLEVSFKIFNNNSEPIGNPNDLEQVRTDRVSAQFNLGLMYLQGNEVPQDYREAEKWFRKAAEQGNTSAQCMLGSMYAAGLGVAENNIQAYMWLILSIDGSKGEEAPFLQKATELCNTIVKNMTPQQIEEVQSLASEWKPIRLSIPKQISGTVLKSRLIKQVTPEYPEAARREGVQGVVILVITVDEEGNVEEIKIARKVHPLLDEAAIAAVKQWKYSPTLLNGEPIPVTATVTVNFEMDRR
jgi:TonB family protein